MEARASRLLPADLLRVGAVGLRTRRLRAALSGLGIAIGIAAMVAVLGISESSKAELLSSLDRLGTNLLTVAPGRGFTGEESELPSRASDMIARIETVEATASTKLIEDATVRRNELIPEEVTGGIAVAAAELRLPRTLGATLARGRWLNPATARYPAVILGSVAAGRLAITRPGINVWLAERWFTVVGILDPVVLDPGIDRSALIGYPVADRLLGANRSPTTIYVRARDESVERTSTLLPATANPENPDQTDVSRPSDALEARAAARSAFTSLFLGLGAVALVVGGVGIANMMVISVLERRSEIGLRRAIGATRRHIATQFLAESLMLGALGGIGGALLGGAVTTAYAASRDWHAVVPPQAMVGAPLAALVIGGIAGFYPALRAARLSPTDALRTA